MTQKSSESFFVFGANADFVEGLYESYLQDPSSVDESWQNYFSSLGPGNLKTLQESIQARQPMWEHPKTPSNFVLSNTVVSPSSPSSQFSSLSNHANTMPLSVAESTSQKRYGTHSEFEISQPQNTSKEISTQKTFETNTSFEDNSSIAHQRALNSIRVLQMIRAYRVRGHLKAQLDPLGLTQPRHYA